MTASSRRSPLVGRFYSVRRDRHGTIALGLSDGPLAECSLDGGVLISGECSVSCRAVCVVDSGTELVGVALEPLVLRRGGLCFDPAAGGVPTRDNRLARGAFNDVVTESARFGMVNAFFHAGLATRYLNRILHQLGAPPLPTLPVVVSAHSGSRLPGFAQNDGDFRSGGRRPLSGGHYRVSRRTTGVPEPIEVCPSGEVHLGPGRLRQRFAGYDGYVRAASHNPATIYHEVGHHLCRHTVDFRLNAERPPDQQLNGKPGVEEGVCDYFAASLLGTGRPYGWYRPERGARRDPDSWRQRPQDDVCDGYAVGARWAAVWWHCRHRLCDTGLLDAEGHDRAMVATLITLGQIAGPGPRRSGRIVRQEQRASADSVIGAYLESVRREGGPRALDLAGRLVAGAPLDPAVAEQRQSVC